MDQPEVASAIYWLGWLELIKRIGGFMVIAGVAIEVGGDWVSAPFHQRVENARELELAALKADAESAKALIATANARAAQADQKAAEASLALAKLTTPRRLTVEQKADLTRSMKDFANVDFAMSAVGAEALDFANDLAEALIGAGWKWINWPLGGIVTRPPNGKPEIGLDMLKGIETHVFDSSQERVSVELYQSLSRAGFKNQWIKVSPPRSGLERTIVVLIGSKE